MKTGHLLFATLILFLFCLNKVHAQQSDDLGLDRSYGNVTAEFNAKKEPFHLPNKLIQPPVKAWDIPKKQYEVDGITGGKISCESGTIIRIPPNAFVDESGKKVTGDVQIDYREFRNPLDFIFSGIPMTYNSGGKENNFQSAGMFEITASQQGTQIYLSGNKSLDVDFVSNDSSTAYNFYVLDEKKGTWVNKGKPEKPNVWAKPEQRTVFSDAVYAYLNHCRELRNYRLYDTTSFSQRYADTTYYFTGQKKQTDFRWNSGTNLYTMFNSPKHYRSMIKINRVRDTKKGETAFSMIFTGREFPEMQAFYGKKWVLTDPETRSSFRTKFGSRNAFNDIRLEQEGEGYAITLKSLKGFVTMHAYPVSSTLLEREEHPAKYSPRIMKYYARRLERREAHFNKMLARDKKENQKEYLSETSFWKAQKEHMTDYEKGLTYNGWKQHCDSVQTANRMNFSGKFGKEESVFRTVALVALGVYNFDHICMLPSPSVIHATVKDQNGVALRTKATYLIDGRTNGIQKFKGSNGNSGVRIKYYPETQNMLVCITEDGTIAYCAEDRFKTETWANDKSPCFPVLKMDPNSMSLTQFKNAIGMK